ncbi:hypothetical protein U1Q18_007986 [Sarracenia purpurea var. burkii]
MFWRFSYGVLAQFFFWFWVFQGFDKGFERRGWTPLLLDAGDVCLDLVREFYANLVPTPNEDSFSTYVRGHEIYMAGIVMSEYLQITDLVIFDYPPVPSNVNYHLVADTLCGHRRPWIGRTLPQHELTEDYHLLHLIVSSTIHPREHVSDINQERGYELYDIGTNQDIALSELIVSTMRKIPSAQRSVGLPYGLLISNCLRDLEGFEMPTDLAYWSVTRSITLRTLRQSAAHVSHAPPAPIGKEPAAPT